MPNKNDRFNVLSLSGGGYRGIYTLSVLEELEKMNNGKPIAKSCDLITGTSVGGIIALALAAEIPVKEIKDFFEKNKYKIFKKSFLSDLSKYFNVKYKQEPLKKALIDFFEVENKIKKIYELKHPVVITAVNYEHQSGQYFKTPHHKDLKRDFELDIVDVALATSAAPTFFPSHKIKFKNGEVKTFIDGGLSNNSPSFIGYHEAIKFFNKKQKYIYLMSIGTASDRFQEYEIPRGGLISWGEKAIYLSMSTQEKSADYITGHLLDKRYLKIDSLIQDGTDHKNNYKDEKKNDYCNQIALDDISNITIKKLKKYARNSLKNLKQNNAEWINNFLKHKSQKYIPKYGGTND